jgi:hypothetical protein
MLRQLNSHQLAEMYAYYRVEHIPVTEEEKAHQRAHQLREMFRRTSSMNEPQKS